MQNHQQKMNTKGAHQMFIELLESFRLDDKYIQPFILQLKKTFVSMKKEAFENRDVLAKKIKRTGSGIGYSG